MASKKAIKRAWKVVKDQRHDLKVSMKMLTYVTKMNADDDVIAVCKLQVDRDYDLYQQACQAYHSL